MDLNKLKRLCYLYSPKPTTLIFLQDSSIITTQNNGKDATINLGLKTPYTYTNHLSQEGYQMFLEGLLFFEIARLTFTDDRVFKQVIQEANHAKIQTQKVAKAFLNKKIDRSYLEEVLFDYIKKQNIAPLLFAIEQGAIENALGQKIPSSFYSIMFVRKAKIIHALEPQYQLNNLTCLADKVILEMMLLCTYGYRFKLENGIIYLPHYFAKDFQKLKQLAIDGRLKTSNTIERLQITYQIINYFSDIFKTTVFELIDTIQKTKQFSNLGSSLFSSMNEIAVSFSHSKQNTSNESTPPKYHFDLSDEEYQRIESLENQEDRALSHQILKELNQRENFCKEKQEEVKAQNILNDTSYRKKIFFSPFQAATPSKYGVIAKNSKTECINQARKFALLLKREIMYASKNQTKHRLEYGTQLDYSHLYNATLDGRIFKKDIRGQKKDLIISILVDNSESMNGQKIINAMKGCFELAYVMQTLNIPFTIYGHKALGHERIQMTKIIDFKESTKRNLLDRIFEMYASGLTYEHLALQEVLYELSLQKRHKKGFVFVLSDGDTHGIHQIHNLTQIYKNKKDIDIIGIGIQTKQIVETYPNHIYVQNLEQLPEILIQKLKEIAF